MSEPGSSPAPVTPVGGSTTPPPRRGFGAYRWFWAIALLTFASDQGTKAWIVHRLPFNTYGEATGAIPIMRGLLYIVHVGNTGAAWSLFSGKSVMLALLAAVTLGAIFLWRRALGLGERPAQVCFGLLCGGIVGNLLDRVVHGYVIDFIDVHFGSYVYPTFNVADSGICVGVVLYLILNLRSGER